MAREPSVLDDSRSTGHEDGPVDDGGNDGLLDRRSYMKLAGTTTAAAAVASAGTLADDDYEVVEARGQTITIGQGETYENKLIDVSNGNGVTLYVVGSATIRNVGFEGLYRGDGFVISIATSGEVTFENVYIGDGATKEGESFVHGPGAVFYHRGNSADITFERCNVQGWPNNAFYLSNTASGGRVTFRDCYGKNNGVTTFRCSDGDRIENCVAYNDDTDYGPGWGGYTEDSGRPVWVWGGGGGAATIEDSNFAAGGYTAAILTHGGGTAQMNGGAFAGGTQGSVSTSNVGNDPDLSIPEGCPTSAVEAASGGASGGGSSGGDEDEADDDEDELPNVVLFDGDDSGVTRYEFDVDGEVVPSNYLGATIDDAAAVDGGLAQGVVADWKDAFRFSGDLEELTVDGPATVLVNDEEVDPDDYGEELPHVLEVVGHGSPTNFEVTVEGTIELAGDADPEEEATTISGSTVGSSVTDGSQTFRFSGALTDVTIIDGEATVTLDGEEVDTDDYGDHEVLPHALVVDGTEAEEPSAYSFEASGAVVESTYRAATVDDEDVIDGRSVRGVVGDSLDAYWFEGEITDFRLAGEASVDVQYNVRGQ